MRRSRPCVSGGNARRAAGRGRGAGPGGSGHPAGRGPSVVGGPGRVARRDRLILARQGDDQCLHRRQRPLRLAGRGLRRPRLGWSPRRGAGQGRGVGRRHRPAAGGHARLAATVRQAAADASGADGGCATRGALGRLGESATAAAAASVALGGDDRPRRVVGPTSGAPARGRSPWPSAPRSSVGHGRVVAYRSQKSVDELRVELRPGVAAQLGDRRVVADIARLYGRSWIIAS